MSDLSARPAFTDHYLRDYRLARANPVGIGAAARFLLEAPLVKEYAEMAITESTGRGGSSRRGAWAARAQALAGRVRVHAEAGASPASS